MSAFRFLEPDEASVLCEAIGVAYGDSYDVRWVYDIAEVSARLAAGTYVVLRRPRPLTGSCSATRG